MAIFNSYFDITRGYLAGHGRLREPKRTPFFSGEDLGISNAHGADDVFDQRQLVLARRGWVTFDGE